MQHGVRHAGCCSRSSQLMSSEVVCVCVCVCASMMLLLLLLIMMMMMMMMLIRIMSSQVMAVMKCKLLTVHYMHMTMLQYIVHILRLFSCMHCKRSLYSIKLGNLCTFTICECDVVIVSVKSLRVCMSVFSLDLVLEAQVLGLGFEDQVLGLALGLCVLDYSTDENRN